jgi:hypothetical protein
MQRFAQTITTLYAEAREAGWRLDDLLALRDAHELAVRLFAGQHRPCGKPFTCHLVGTASVLVHAGAPAPVAAAGLLHAAYRFGVFDRGVTGPCVPARRLVRGAVGPDVESLVFGYETLPWDPSSIRALSRMGVPEGSEEVVAMRLANVVEECFDGGMLYSLKWEAKRDLVAGAQGELLGIAHSLRPRASSRRSPTRSARCASSASPRTSSRTAGSASVRYLSPAGAPPAAPAAASSARAHEGRQPPIFARASRTALESEVGPPSEARCSASSLLRADFASGPISPSAVTAISWTKG